MSTKDRERITNLYTRSNGYTLTAVKLAEKMAKSIKSVKKAEQRGAAVTEVDPPSNFTDHDVALICYIFASRVAELEGKPALVRPEPELPPVVRYELTDLEASARSVGFSLHGAGSNNYRDYQADLDRINSLIERARANGGFVEVQPPAPPAPPVTPPMRYTYPRKVAVA